MSALGLLLLAAAAVVTLVGVLTNRGDAHTLNSDFSVFGYHVHGSTGQLLLIGVVVGAVGMLGLTMLLAGFGRGFSRRIATRRELKQSRQQAGTLFDERASLAHQLDEERIARTRMEAERTAAGNPTYAPSGYPVDPRTATYGQGVSPPPNQ